jgi:hypothetical protein
VRDVIDAEEEEDEGEDLFGPGIEEYAAPFCYIWKMRSLNINTKK